MPREVDLKVMQIIRQGIYSQIRILEDDSYSFLTDVYVNRRIISEWIASLAKVASPARASDKVIPLFEEQKPKATILSIIKKTDKIELSITEADYVEIQVHLKNPTISKTFSEDILSWKGFLELKDLLRFIKLLSPDFTNYTSLLNKAFPNVIFSDNNVFEPVISLMPLKYNRDIALTERERANLVSKLKNYNYDHLSNKELIDLYSHLLNSD